MKTFVLLVLALAGGGCRAPNESVTDGDRAVVHQTVQAASIVQAQLELAFGLLAGDFPKIREALEALEVARRPAIDARANSEQLAANFGPPKDPKPYSDQASDDARKQSAKEHSGGGFWAAVGGIAITLGSLVWAFVKTTAAKHAAEAVETLVGAGMNVKNKAAEGTMSKEDVTQAYKAAVALAPAPVKAKIEETLTRVKKKINGIAPPVPTET